MENTANKIINKKGKFNIVDVAVIIFIGLFIFGTFCIFDPLGWFSDVTRHEVAISYVIELKSVDRDLTDNIRSGDNVINASTDGVMGKICAIEVRPSYEWKSVNESSEMVRVEVEGKSDIYIKVDINCIYESGMGYIIDGQQLAVGSQVNIKLPHFVGSGYCISITDLE